MKATIATKNIKIERAGSKGCPQESCLGPGMWNIFYNQLLKLKFNKRYKNNSVRRRPQNTDKREVGKRNRKHSQYGSDENMEVGKK